MRSEIDILKDVLDYNPETGIFTRKVNCGRSPAGSVFGTPDKDGYLTIQVCGKKYKAHRLAFVFMLGRWPFAEVDHKDGTPSHNAWCNLREATRSDNCANSDRSVGATGLRGVKYDPRASKWRARIAYRGSRKYVGAYATKEEAYEAYLQAAASTHGEFALHKRPHLGA